LYRCESLRTHLRTPAFTVGFIAQAVLALVIFKIL
jgi:hypothetical protein